MLFSMPGFTLMHVLVSLLGMIGGLVVVGGFMAGAEHRGWTTLFLVTTALANLSGFGFPFATLLPSHIVGAVSLVILLIAVVARYGKRLAGPWRRVFVVSAVAMLYLNVFVLLAQLFQKIPALIMVAPTPSAPVFALTQALALGIFVWLGRAAVVGFGAIKPV